MEDTISKAEDIIERYYRLSLAWQYGRGQAPQVPASEDYPYLTGCFMGMLRAVVYQCPDARKLVEDIVRRAEEKGQ